MPYPPLPVNRDGMVSLSYSSCGVLCTHSHLLTKQLLPCSQVLLPRPLATAVVDLLRSLQHRRLRALRTLRTMTPMPLAWKMCPIFQHLQLNRLGTTRSTMATSFSSCPTPTTGLTILTQRQPGLSPMPSGPSSLIMSRSF